MRLPGDESDTQRSGSGCCAGKPTHKWPEGARRGRGVHLTREVGGEFQGLTRPWFLANHFLEVNLDDLDQVPCGEAALIPRDLVDRACRDMDSVSSSARAQHRVPYSPQAMLCHTFVHTVPAAWSA
jgi:hypothetical protein